MVWLRIVAILSIYADMPWHKRVRPDCMIAFSAPIRETIPCQLDAQFTLLSRHGLSFSAFYRLYYVKTLLALQQRLELVEILAERVERLLDRLRGGEVHPGVAQQVDAIV